MRNRRFARRLAAALLAAVLLASPAVSSQAEVVMSDDGLQLADDLERGAAKNKEFTIEEGVLKKYTGKAAKVVIPGNVTSIGWLAFDGTKWQENERTQNPLVVVNGILIEGFFCKKSNITIPGSVKGITSGAFMESGLKTVTIPGSLKSISPGAFALCYILKTVTIQKGVKSIGDRAFSFCYALKTVTIPDSVKSISDSAFSDCGKFTIRGKSSSYAQKYAKEHGIPFSKIR